MKIISAADYLPQIIQANSSLAEFELTKQVRKIILEVQSKGDAALLAYSAKFDLATPAKLKVDPKHFKQAFDKIGAAKIELLKTAAKQIREFHQHNHLESWQKKYADGTILGQITTPVQKVGIYVPGGKAAYPSTLLMNVIPAQIAGVEEIVVVSPPNENGEPNLAVMAACHLLKIDKVYATGGAQAIAALAFGTDSVPKVYKICGPGNRYVTEAKRQLFGVVGIDSLAGPSEVTIYCDIEDFSAVKLGSDLLAQAEHDPLAKVVLITPHTKLARRVGEFLNKTLNQQPRYEIIRKALTKGAFVIVKNPAEAAKIINESAPEHLEIFCDDDNFLKLIKNVGAIFKGDYATAVSGDYMAGPNHTIPTMGAARFSSPLSVNDFLKTSSLVDLSEKRFKKLAPKIIEFAKMEGLFAHAEAIAARLKKGMDKH